MSVTTDGTSAMAGEKRCCSISRETRARNWHSKQNYEIALYYSPEGICAKSSGMQEVMQVVMKTVNFISRDLNHQQFQQLLLEAKAQYYDLLDFCEVHWLSRCAKVEWVYEL